MKTRWPSVPWIAGGLLWVANGAQGLNAPDGSRHFLITELVWIPVHLLIAVGIWMLLRDRALQRPSVRAGLLLAATGRVVFLIAEFAAIVVADDEVFLFPIAAISTAVGMAVAGVGIIRGRSWPGWGGFAPLAVGIYPFVAMFPLLAITGERPNAAVTGWGLTLVAVGLGRASIRELPRTNSEPAPQAVPATFAYGND